MARSAAQATVGELIVWYGPIQKASLAFDRGDANQEKAVDLGDPIFILTFLFAGGQAPPDPFGRCGLHPTGDDLDCRDSACDW